MVRAQKQDDKFVAAPDKNPAAITEAQIFALSLYKAIDIRSMGSAEK